MHARSKDSLVSSFAGQNKVMETIKRSRSIGLSVDVEVRRSRAGGDAVVSIDVGLMNAKKPGETTFLFIKFFGPELAPKIRLDRYSGETRTL